MSVNALQVLFHCDYGQKDSIRKPATQAVAAAEEKSTPSEKVPLGSGSLLGGSPTVQVNREGMDEGNQAEQRQADVHLKGREQEKVNGSAERPSLVL